MDVHALRSQTTTARIVRSTIAAACALILAGCDNDSQQVRTYEAPKEDTAKPAAQQQPVAASGDAPDMVVTQLTWELPEGWREEPNPNQMRFATLVIGDGDGRFEVAVSKLGGRAGGVVPNINRWRGQLGLAPGSEEEIAHQTTPIQAGDQQGLLVDLLGPAAEGSDAPPLRMLVGMFAAPMETWFLKVTASSPVIEANRASFVKLCESVRVVAAPQLPPGHVPIGGAMNGELPPMTMPQMPTPQPPAANSNPSMPSMGQGMPSMPQVAPAGGGPTWDSVPAGWSLDATPRTMALESYTVTSDGETAAMTVTVLGGAQDLLGNINRWRRQAGLEPIGGVDELPPDTIDVAGTPGLVVDIVGEATHIVGVIAQREGQTWFYKLFGPDPLVAGQKDTFKSFVGAARFDGG